MKKVFTIAGAALLAASISGAAFAQANPNAPQPSSTGAGVNTPGTSPTGQAIDRPTTGSARAKPMATGSEAGNNADSLHGSNSATGGGSNTANGLSSGGGSSGGGR